MEFTVADDDRKSESAYRKVEVLFFGGGTFAHIWFWTPYCQSCYIFDWGALPPWTSQQGHCPCTLPGPRRPLHPDLFPFFQNFTVSPMYFSSFFCVCVVWLFTVPGVWHINLRSDYEFQTLPLGPTYRYGSWMMLAHVSVRFSVNLAWLKPWILDHKCKLFIPYMTALL